jgi:DNA primase
LIEEAIIQTIKERADILSIVGELVSLKRAGAAYKGLCPFHGEKTASFTVNPQQNTYHCFGCHAHGDSLRFLMDTQKLNFIEAVKILAQKVGVEIPESHPLSQKQRKQRQQKKELTERLFDIQESLTQWYEQSLARSSQAQSYLQQRGISRKAAKAFRLGWASDDVGYFVQWVQKAQVDLEDLQQLGVVIAADETQTNKGDSRLKGGRLRFRNRVMCPIFDMQDRVVGYSGRVINPHQKIAKYLNSPETPIFTKGHNLYGLKTAKVAARHPNTPYIILCEGNLDVISLWQADLPYAVAAMGTAITEQQAILLKRLSKQVLCMMDGDQAGQRAALKSLPILLKQGLEVRGRLLPDGHDPDSFLKEHGVASLTQWIKGAIPLLLTQLTQLAQNHPRDPIGNAAVLKVILPLIRLLKDEQQKPLFLDEVAQVLSIDRHQLTDMMIRQQNTPTKAVNSFSKQSVRSASSNESISTSHRANEVNSTSHLEYNTTEAGDSEWVQSPWWTFDQLHKSKAKKKPWEKSKKGNIQIKLRTPLRVPQPLALSQTHQNQITGYERELISTLFHIPELIAPFIEREAHLLFSQSILGDFIVHLQKNLVATGYTSGSEFLKQCSDQNLVAEIQDSLSLHLGVGSEVEKDQLLNDLIHRLKKGHLQNHLTDVCRQLSNTGSEDQQQRARLFAQYQNLQSQLKTLQDVGHFHGP